MRVSAQHATVWFVGEHAFTSEAEAYDHVAEDLLTDRYWGWGMSAACGNTDAATEDRRLVTRLARYLRWLDACETKRRHAAIPHPFPTLARFDRFTGWLDEMIRDAKPKLGGAS